MRDEETEDVTFTLVLTVTKRRKPGTLRDLELALLTYAGNMNFVRDAWVITQTEDA